MALGFASMLGLDGRLNHTITPLIRIDLTGTAGACSNASSSKEILGATKGIRRIAKACREKRVAW